MSAVVFAAHSVNPTGCVSKRGYSLAVWAVALLPYFVLVCGDNSFTFQSAYFCLALMVFAAFFSRERVAYSRHAIGLIVSYLIIMGVGNFVTLAISSEMITSRSLVRALMFFAIIWFFAHAISRRWSPREIAFLLESVALSTLASAFLELKTWVENGFYAGRVYPVSLTGHMIDANFFALLLVVQISCAFLLVVYSGNVRAKILYFILISLGLASVMLTGSRSGLLCVALVIAFGYIAFACSERTGKLSTTVFILVLVAVALFLINRFMGDWMFDRFFKNSYDDGSNQFRVELWVKAVQRWMSRPLFGFGVGNYNYFSAADWGVVETATTTHGTVTDFLVDFGMIGLLLFFSVLIRIFSGLFQGKGYTPLALCPGIVVCWLIVGAERTVALWLFLIIFYVLADYLSCNQEHSMKGLLSER